MIVEIEKNDSSRKYNKHDYQAAHDKYYYLDFSISMPIIDIHAQSGKYVYLRILFKYIYTYIEKHEQEVLISRPQAGYKVLKS